MAMMSAGQLIRHGPITEAEWEAQEDPPEGRYEVIDGQVVMTPSDGAHNRYGEDLSAMLRMAVWRADLPYDVTIDVEWRTVEASIVKQAPRGDVVIGKVDEEKGIHLMRPLLVAEIWDPLSRPKVRNERRLYWARLGVPHYIQVLLVDPAVAEVYDLAAPLAPVRQAVGHQVLAIDEPFPIEFVPDRVVGWGLRQAIAAETAQAEISAAVAEAEAATAQARAALDRVAELEAELAEAKRQLGRPDGA